ncbi:hypothetical protein Hanom_Chr16g01492721 [Helianthus anomalus]
MANVLFVLSHILQILELTTPWVVLARPRVGCQFCPLLLSFLLQRFWSWTRPLSGGHGPVSGLLILLFCWFGCDSGLGELRQSSFFVFMLVFLLFCSFCTFMLF